MTSTDNKEIIVVKFGGSVLEDERSIEQAAQLVRDTTEKGLGVVVVVSAMKGVTDQLIALSKKVDPGMEASRMDELLSSGEKTSARLMAGALAGHGIRSVVVDPESPYWPVVTDARHLDANPIMELSRLKAQEAMMPLLREGKVPVVCGFLGKTVDGKTTTLGRGGSDTTAVILGNCLDAKEVVLIKDVEGVYSSDPDKVRNPQFIETLNGEEAEMLAAGGAKFLHLKALRYQTNGLRIRVTSLEKLNAGTVIKGDLAAISLEVFPQGVSMITIVGLDAKKLESVSQLTRAVRDDGGSLLALSLETTSAIFYVAGGKNVLDEVHHVLVSENIGKAVSSFDGLSMITVKGTSLETETGVVQRITQPLARSNINLYGIVTIRSSIRVFVSSDQAEKALELIREAMMVNKS
ncbi:MAG: ACT domain-containing protein [Thaumarchaeota archaeon]|nr:ACT domain-containing protein [Nitrososphaerota archaeon]